MNTSTVDSQSVTATHLVVTGDTMKVDLSDGRSIAVPLAWYPRLLHGTAEERGRWQLIGQGIGIHWPDLDEDLSVAGLLAGRMSAESPQSFLRWLGRRPIAENAPPDKTRSQSTVPANGGRQPAGGAAGPVG